MTGAGPGAAASGEGPPALGCPDCGTALHAVGSRGTLAHRCGRCRGVWLDPEAFRQVCEQDEASPGEATALARRGAAAAPPPLAEPAVRYRACPACGDVMSRTNFAKVSGVLIDVCRAHGAWFDKGELAAIRAFLRAGGAGRYRRHLALREERTASRPSRAHDRGVVAAADVYDVLMTSDAWAPPGRYLLAQAAALAALGAWFLWDAFHPRHFGRGLFGVEEVLAAVGCAIFAWRALARWQADRRR